jgi:hypothetical protein
MPDVPCCLGCYRRRESRVLHMCPVRSPTRVQERAGLSISTILLHVQLPVAPETTNKNSFPQRPSLMRHQCQWKGGVCVLAIRNAIVYCVRTHHERRGPTLTFVRGVHEWSHGILQCGRIRVQGNDTCSKRSSPVTEIGKPERRMYFIDVQSAGSIPVRQSLTGDKYGSWPWCVH